MRTIYNTSFIIPEEIEEEWVAFMRQHYLAALTDHHLCQDVIFTKVSIDQSEGKTYSLQLVFNTRQQQECFVKNHLPDLEEKIRQHYANRYLCFSSILTEI